jgi:uncharacterized protein YecE (DUF72 family)
MNYIGISGWTYEPWRGTFYPEDLPQKRELEYASRQLNSIEINGTFYSLQKPGSFRTWYEQTPDDFVFSLKGGRFITHIRRLRDIETPLANFFASGVLALKQKLGPILWQFPPNFKFDAERFEPFFELLPHDTEAAAELACKHDKNWKGEVCLETDQRRPVRHAVEFRHDSFLTPDFAKLLRKHKIGLVVADTAGLHPYAEDVTADFVYLRLHGAEEIYVSGYTDEALNRWADRIRAWSTGGQPPDAKVLLDQPPPKRKGRDVYAYFDNDVKVRSPADAKSLAKLLSSD